jgi:hypothetical protein
MPACRDHQHEHFARALVEEYLRVPPSSTGVQEAYKRAGYAPHRGNCHRLANEPHIKARVDELMEEAREYADLRLVKALVRVNRIADAKLPDYYEPVSLQPDGAPTRTMRLRDLSSLPPQLAEAISEIDFHDDGTVRKIKLHDKLQANITLLRHFGDVPDERPVQQVNILNTLSPEDQRLLADALELLAKPATGTAAEAEQE